MTEEQTAAAAACLARIKAQIGNGDYQLAHIEADDALTDLLTALGFTEIVEAYNAVGKWYA